MANKRKGKGAQAGRARQQQEAAARRRGIGPAGGQRRGERAPAANPAASVPAGRDKQPPGMERDYLDVSAVRIQEWLGRTRTVRFRRGASVLLGEATSREYWTRKLPAGVEWNEEAGDIDGVVSLVAGTDVPDARACLDAAAREVTLHMRSLMPYIHIQAVAGHGSSYAAAYPQMARARGDAVLVIDAPPAPQEMVLAKPCDQCRSAGATHPKVTIVTGEKLTDLCGDCHARFKAAGGTGGNDPRRAPKPELRTIEALAAVGVHVRGFSDNFAEMVAAGQVSADDTSTQLALIYADGNRVGAFLTAAAGSAAVKKSDIARMINDATIGALADAVIDRFGSWQQPAVLVNLAGGDDLLVSVPAADAWLFTKTLLASFGRRLAAGTGGWPPGVSSRCPTLSAGLVFHYRTHPFSDALRLAQSELDKAKRAAWAKRHERQATVSFLDMTADGEQAPDGRIPLTLAEMDQHAESLEALERIPASHRHALLALIRQGAVDDLIRRVTDFGNEPVWDIIAGKKATPDMVREVLAGEQARAGLRRLLDLARHWRTQPRPEPAR